MEDVLDLQCCVCTQVYSDKAPPRNLGCGHCVCSTCLKELISISSECPECRKSFKAKCVTKLSINHSLLRLSRMYAYVNQGADEGAITQLILTQPEGGPAESVGICSLHGQSMYFMCMRCDVPICRLCLASEHPDQPYGKCIILSLKDITNKVRESNLKLFSKYLKDVEECHKLLVQLNKGYHIAVKYWETRPEDKRGHDYDKNLEHVRSIHQDSTKDLDEGVKWKTCFTQAKEKMEKAATKVEVMSLAEHYSKLKYDFETFQAKERETEFYKTLDTFWTGEKFKLR